MLRAEFLHLATAVHRMLVPQQDKPARSNVEQLPEKLDHALSIDQMPVGVHRPLGPALSGVEAEHPDRIHWGAALDACPDQGRVSPLGP
jgi:hypothetical protein